MFLSNPEPHMLQGMVYEPRSVLIIGGGDGGVCNEVLKHPSVRKVY